MLLVGENARCHRATSAHVRIPDLVELAYLKSQVGRVAVTRSLFSFGYATLSQWCQQQIGALAKK